MLQQKKCKNYEISKSGMFVKTTYNDYTMCTLRSVSVGKSRGGGGENWNMWDCCINIMMMRVYMAVDVET